MDKFELLKRANEEIKTLRAQNQLMSARLGVFDDMMMMLKSAACYPAYTGAVHPDVVHELEKSMHEIEKNKTDKL